MGTDFRCLVMCVVMRGGVCAGMAILLLLYLFYMKIIYYKTLTSAKMINPLVGGEGTCTFIIIIIIFVLLSLHNIIMSIIVVYATNIVRTHCQLNVKSSCVLTSLR